MDVEYNELNPCLEPCAKDVL